MWVRTGISSWGFWIRNGNSSEPPRDSIDSNSHTFNRQVFSQMDTVPFLFSVFLILPSKSWFSLRQREALNDYPKLNIYAFSEFLHVKSNISQKQVKKIVCTLLNKVLSFSFNSALITFSMWVASYGAKRIFNKFLKLEMMIWWQKSDLITSPKNLHGAQNPHTLTTSLACLIKPIKTKHFRTTYYTIILTSSVLLKSTEVLLQSTEDRQMTSNCQPSSHWSTKS